MLRNASPSFNLVIEVLLISRLLAGDKVIVQLEKFQSRNRGSFDFKRVSITRRCRMCGFQSRNRGSFDFK